MATRAAAPKAEIRNPPTSDQVQEFHFNDDLDVSTTSHHHSLGPTAGQASPGDHMHDGGSSPLLLGGIVLTGDTGDGTALQSVIAAVVRLGAQDQTTSNLTGGT